MELLKRRIIADGLEMGTEIVKVDSFLNHQLDIGLFMALGKEIHHRLQDENINKILTIEASGIGIASVTAIYFDLVPVVFAKKNKPNTMANDEVYSASIKSFTKGNVTMAQVSKNFLNPEDRVLIIDDFIAHGEAAAGLCDLVEQAGAEVVSVVGIVEKKFQGGSQKIRDLGYRVESLAVITKIEEGKIHFEED